MAGGTGPGAGNGAVGGVGVPCGAAGALLSVRPLLPPTMGLLSFSPGAAVGLEPNPDSASPSHWLLGLDDGRGGVRVVGAAAVDAAAGLADDAGADIGREGWGRGLDGGGEGR